MKSGFRRGGMQTSGLAIFTVVVLAVVGIVLLEVGAVGGIEEAREDAAGSERAVGQVASAKPAWQSYGEPTTRARMQDATSGVGTTHSAPAVSDYASAERLYNDGRYEEATQAFTAYTRQHPEGLWGHYMLGLSAWKAGELVQGIAALRQAVALDSAHVKSFVNLARVLLEAGRAWEALEAIQQVDRLDPAAPGVQRVLGRCYHENDQLADAEAAYQRAIRLDANDVWAFNNLGLIYIEQQRFEEGLYALASAAVLRDDIPEVQNNLGVALERTGHPLAAIQAYARALETDSAYEKAKVSLDRVLPVAESVDDTDVDLRALAAQFRLEDGAQPQAEEVSGHDSATAPARTADPMRSEAVR